ncbi:MAG TPA: bifunctional YncE family protein/alkaline phosphatase family protein [Armatimonadaceae bacterium]|nr:bifunctional YncE family protein/alkaline phosphatase family protein [Armatimonadaceae bacterium]
MSGHEKSRAPGCGPQPIQFPYWRNGIHEASAHSDADPRFRSGARGPRGLHAARGRGVAVPGGTGGGGSPRPGRAQVVGRTCPLRRRGAGDAFRSPAPLLLAALCLFALAAPSPAFAEPPAGERTARTDRKAGTAILPSGRLVTPRGRTVTVAPHPYGLALSPDGSLLAVVSSGTGPFALTLISTSAGSAPPRVITAAREPEFKSTYRGVAVAPDNRTVYVSGGNDGRVHVFDAATGRRTGSIPLDGELGGAKVEGSLPSALALTRDGRTLYACDQGNWRLVRIDTATARVTDAAPTGRLPFAVALSPDGRHAYVANIGLFEYRRVEAKEGADPRGLTFPPFGYPSKAAREGAEVEGRAVPGLGHARIPEAYSVWGFDLSGGGTPKAAFKQTTGIPVAYGEEGEDEDEPGEVKGAVGGSAPCALATSGDRVYVSNANNDTIDVLDAATGRRVATIPLSGLLPDPKLRALRGITPYGLALSPDGGRLYAALSGFNAVAVIDARAGKPLGMIPAGWYAAQVAVSPDGKRLYTASAKGLGSGPNGGRAFAPGPEGSGIGGLMKGLVTLADAPADRDLPALTRAVLANNGALSAPKRPAKLPPIKHAVVIVKENRTYDEVFGALPGGRGDATLARFGAPQRIEGIGTDEPVVVMPNHLALARRFARSDNFYVDSDHSADGHRWAVGVAPNHWTESVVSAAYGGQMGDKTDSPAPGRRMIFGANSSLTPEDYLEAGSLWHHLARHNVPFGNWGEGFEFAGISESAGLKPTGARLPLNVPMPLPLFKATSRHYPGYNMNIPDQYRADVFLREYAERFESGKEPLPGLLFVHLPNDHGAGPRPKDGYPATASYMADNDYALGRIVERLSRSRHWKEMAIFITEDDAQGGVDSVDAHRSVLMVVSPWVKRGHVSKRVADFSALHRSVFELLNVPPLSLYDALAGNLSDF